MLGGHMWLVVTVLEDSDLDYEYKYHVHAGIEIHRSEYFSHTNIQNMLCFQVIFCHVA